MLLSMAIRIGSALRPQAFGPIFKDGCSCTLGAALEGSNIQEYSVSLLSVWKPIRKLFFCSNIDGDALMKCPGCFKETPIIYIIGEHLNDIHKWTREAIADWVEANLENSDEVTVEKVGELVEVGK